MLHVLVSFLSFSLFFFKLSKEDVTYLLISRTIKNVLIINLCINHALFVFVKLIKYHVTLLEEINFITGVLMWRDAKDIIGFVATLQQDEQNTLC